MWRKEELDREMTWEEFQARMLAGDLAPWIGKRPRSLRSWLYSVQSWAQGDH